MPLNIKNEHAHELARELAELTNLSLTDAVTQALRESVAHHRRQLTADRERMIADLARIADNSASLPILDPRSPDEILGYDRNGVPG